MFLSEWDYYDRFISRPSTITAKLLSGLNPSAAQTTLYFDPSGIQSF